MVHVNENSNGEANGQSCATNNSGNSPHSANNIGREFVRQYYTMLCSGPKFMHRFYGNDSLYVRGDTVVVGQSSIEKYIKDSKQKHGHTKIRAIDAHETISNGVVIQVVGEVSLNNEPFRYFVQTFVLAPQSPKRFYVHNDTLRFLDDLLYNSVGTSERLNSVNTVNENETDTERISPNVHVDIGDTNGHPYGDDVTVAAIDSPSYVELQYQPVNHAPLHEQHSASVSRSECPNFVQQQQQPSSGDCSSVVPDLVRDVHSCDQQDVPQLLVYDNTGNNGCHVIMQDNGRPNSTDKGSVGGNEEADEQVNMNGKQAASWARVASKNANHPPVLMIQPPSFSGNIQSTAMISPNQSVITKQPCMENDKQQIIAPVAMNGGTGVRSSYDVMRVSQGSMNGMNNTHARGNSFRQRDQIDRDFQWEYQLFVGNLPAECKEEEIKHLFLNYGNVTKVSIINKASAPPFAFVTFDSVESVKHTVEMAPELFCRNHKLSVEKKKGPEGRFQHDRGDSMNNYQSRANVNPRGGGGGGMSRPYRVNGPFSRVTGAGPGNRTFNNRQAVPMGGHVHGQPQFVGTTNLVPK